MKREIFLHSELDHPHIIKLYDHFEDAENVYLVLEYASRGSLFYEIRRKKKLTEEKARCYFRQTCEAVQYLHEHDIIHRDIKPENVLIDNSGSIKICDFGWCAKGTEARTTFCGTLDYMAPEMIMGEGHSFSVDVWALGVLLYELVHGNAPFAARKDTERCQKILGLSFMMDPSLSEEVRDLIERLLKSVPEERMPLMQVLEHPWVAGRAREESLVGAPLKNYVKGYGMAEGVVTAVTGDMCTVFYRAPNTTEKMLKSRAAKIIKRMNNPQKPVETTESADTPAEALETPLETPLDTPLDISPLVSQGNRSPLEEARLLDKIEEWCKAPSKIPVKKNTFIEMLEESNKKLQESLQHLQLPIQLEAKENPKTNFQEIAMINPPSIPIFAEETLGEEEISVKSEESAYKQAQIRLEEKKEEQGQILHKSQPIATENIEQEGGLVVGIPSVHCQPFQVEPVIPVISRDISPLPAQPGSREERQTSKFSYASSEFLDFETQREQIEERNRLFYVQSDERWIDRQSEESIVHAPKLSSKTPKPDRNPRSLLEEIDTLTKETKRPISSTVSQIQALEQANDALSQRKKQLESLLQDLEAPNELPPLRRPARLPDDDEKGGFLRWIGSIIGCSERIR